MRLAFITSVNAAARKRLFQKIFGVAEEDTGKKVCFHYMHSEGIETITPDAHRGEALGRCSLTNT